MKTLAHLIFIATLISFPAHSFANRPLSTTGARLPIGVDEDEEKIVHTVSLESGKEVMTFYKKPKTGLIWRLENLSASNTLESLEESFTDGRHLVQNYLPDGKLTSRSECGGKLASCKITNFNY